MKPTRSILLSLAVAPLLLAPAASAQDETPLDISSGGAQYRLDDRGRWVRFEAAEPGSDAALMSEARALIAADRAGAAKKLLDTWIKANEFSASPFLAEAYLLRGDAKLALSDEYKALYDYERVVKDFPASEQFTVALERELEVARLYLNGLRRKTFFGLRVDSGIVAAEEIIMRINERLPGSRLAEEALLLLADYYYRKRDLPMAAETYDVFLEIFPRSEFRKLAMERRIYSNIAQFKGPRYDASGLIEARYQILEFADQFPIEAEQAGLSDALIVRLDESAGAQMLETAKWYIRRGDPVSARLTLRRLIEKHPRTLAAAEALRIFDERGWTTTQEAPLAPVEAGDDAAPADVDRERRDALGGPEELQNQPREAQPEQPAPQQPTPVGPEAPR